MSIDTLGVEMTHITGQLQSLEDITHNNMKASYAHLHTEVEPCSCDFLCNREGCKPSTTKK